MICDASDSLNLLCEGWTKKETRKKQDSLLIKTTSLFRIDCIISCNACNTEFVFALVLLFNVFITLRWIQLVTLREDGDYLQGHRFYSKCIFVCFFLDFTSAKIFALILSTASTESPQRNGGRGWKIRASPTCIITLVNNRPCVQQGSCKIITGLKHSCGLVAS